MKDFTHVSNFTGYMRVVADFIIENGKAGQTVLDIPAGNGLMAEELRSKGFAVTCADINSEKPDYIYANMEQALPFPDQHFDFVICIEGIEHVINPDDLVSELCRITKPAGSVIISGSMLFSVEFDITGTDGLAHRLEAEPAARGWMANA